jgi:hypothetical protein
MFMLMIGRFWRIAVVPLSFWTHFGPQGLASRTVEVPSDATSDEFPPVRCVSGVGASRGQDEWREFILQLVVQRLGRLRRERAFLPTALGVPSWMGKQSDARQLLLLLNTAQIVDNSEDA